MHLLSYDQPDSGIEYLGLACNHAAEVYDVISKGSLFGNFNDKEIDTLCHYLRYYRAPVGSVLLREGDEGDFLLVITNGRIVVRKLSLTNQTANIGMVSPGQVIGEMSMIDGERRFATCLATEEVKFGVLTRSDFYELLALHPHVANKFMIMLLQMVVGRLREANMRMVSSLDTVDQ